MQERVYRRLSLIGVGPAAFFADCCRIMADPGQFSTSHHLVGHCLREIESSIRHVLSGQNINASRDATGKGDDNHRREVREILHDLGFSEGEEVATYWLSVAGKNAPGALHARAHRNNLASPRPVDEEFLKAWANLQSMFDVLLDRFESRYALVYRRLDEILKLDTPTQRTLKDLAKNLPFTAATHRYLFSKLASPGWLVPLRADGWFYAPPGREVTDDGGISFPHWPQADYLAKVGPERPDDVSNIISSVETDNVRVHVQLMDVASKLPGLYAARLTPVVVRSFPQIAEFQFDFAVGDFASYLAKGSAPAEALRLTRLLYGLTDDATGTSRKPGDHSGSQHTTWVIERSSKELLPALVHAVGNATVESIAEALELHVRREHWELTGQADAFGTPDGGETRDSENSGLELQDYSTTWLRNVRAEHDERKHHDIRQIIALQLRDAAKQLINGGTATVREVNTILSQFRSLVFRRLQLHLIELYVNSDSRLAFEWLTNQRVVNQAELARDYGRLLAAAMPLLDSNQHRVIVETILKAAPFASLADIARRTPLNDCWKRDQLSLVPAYLNDWERAQLSLFIERQGEPIVDDIDDDHDVSWVGPNSPKSDTELRAMSVQQLADFSRTFVPSGTWGGPSIEGLARTITSAVTESPNTFAAEADAFVGLAPTYVRGFFDGLRNAVRGGKAITSWSAVLTTAAWAVSQPVPTDDADPPTVLDEDPNWRWAWKSIVDLIGLGISVESKISFSERERVWRILERLSADSNPTPAYESRNGGENMDPFTLALNTVRPQAIDAVVRYSFWVSTTLEREGKGEVQARFDLVPEAARLLEEHLDINSDPSAAVRATIGRWLGNLILFDRPWVIRHWGLVMPADPAQASLRDAFWDAYLQYGRLFPNQLDLLEEAYLGAITRIGRDRATRFQNTPPDERLPEHLVQLYFWGLIDLEKPGNLFEHFFNSAGVKSRQHALHHVGWSLWRDSSDVPSEVIRRLERLWDWRASALLLKIENAGQPKNSSSMDPDEALEELGEFGMWFASRKFDVQWALDRLGVAVRATGGAERHVDALEYMCELATDYPKEVIEVLGFFRLTGGKEPWRVQLWREPAKRIMQHVQRLGDPSAKKAAEVLINRWVAAGHSDFAELLAD